MSSTPDVQALAHQMESACEQVRQIAPFSSRVSGFDLDSAYLVADLLHQGRLRRGARPVGRKIGFTNAQLWPVYGVRHPVWGHVYEHTLVRVQGGEAVCSLAGLTEPKIEPEIVLHLRELPPPGAGAEQVLACVDWVAHAFEIVQSHYPGWKFAGADTVVDNALHGRLLLGEPQPVQRLGDDAVRRLREFSLSLHADGERRETARGDHVLGSPLLALAHLAEVLRAQPRQPPLRVGELVSTGTVTQAYAVRPGERWHTTIEGIALPGLAVRFVA